MKEGVGNYPFHCTKPKGRGHLSEIRYDILSGDYAIIATDRAKRPSDFKAAQKDDSATVSKDPNCPFCPGNETKTPPEVFALRTAGERDTEGWSVRVVPNKFPALTPKEQMSEPDLEKAGASLLNMPKASDTFMYWEIPAIGMHEVIVESPEHNGSLGSYSESQLGSIANVLKARTLAMYDSKEIKYVQVFRNQGPAGGASLAHPHFQIIGLPFIPPRVLLEATRFENYEHTTRRCLLCDLVEREIEKGTRIVEKTQDFVAFCPFASRHSFETLIVPRIHGVSFSDAEPRNLTALSEILGCVFHRYESLFTSLSYNLVFHSAPPSKRFSKPYHWHIHVHPRLTVEAGLELGTGVQINPIPPEDAAQQFRSFQ